MSLHYRLSPQLGELAAGDEVVEGIRKQYFLTLIRGAAQLGELTDDVVTLGLLGLLMLAVYVGGCLPAYMGRGVVGLRAWFSQGSVEGKARGRYGELHADGNLTLGTGTREDALKLHVVVTIELHARTQVVGHFQWEEAVPFHAVDTEALERPSPSFSL